MSTFIESMLSSYWWRFLRWLPRFVLRRFFSTQWLAGHTEIDVPSRHDPVEIYASEGEEGWIRARLQIRNHTHFHIELDRVIARFDYGQGICKMLFLSRIGIPPRGLISVPLEQEISGAQFRRLALQHKNKASQKALTVEAEFNSRLGGFAKREELSGLAPKITNEHLLLAPLPTQLPAQAPIPGAGQHVPVASTRHLEQE